MDSEADSEEDDKEQQQNAQGDAEDAARVPLLLACLLGLLAVVGRSAVVAEQRGPLAGGNVVIGRHDGLGLLWGGDLAGLLSKEQPVWCGKKGEICPLGWMHGDDLLIRACSQVMKCTFPTQPAAR